MKLFIMEQVVVILIY